MSLGLGPFELVLVFAVLLLMFGAKRLPELASGMGRGIRGFKQALNGADDPQLPPAPVE
jgi:sec-independent protein translocase protein TatA